MIITLVCFVILNQVSKYMLDSAPFVYVINFLSQDFQNKTLSFLWVKLFLGYFQDYIYFRRLVPCIMPSSLENCRQSLFITFYASLQRLYFLIPLLKL